MSGVCASAGRDRIWQARLAPPPGILTSMTAMSGGSLWTAANPEVTSSATTTRWPALVSRYRSSSRLSATSSTTRTTRATALLPTGQGRNQILVLAPPGSGAPLLESVLRRGSGRSGDAQRSLLNPAGRERRVSARPDGRDDAHLALISHRWSTASASRDGHHRHRAGPEGSGSNSES